MIKMLEKFLDFYAKIKINKWLIYFWVSIPFIVIFFVTLIFIFFWFKSYDWDLYLMDFLNIIDPYILNFWFIYYSVLLWYFITIKSKKIQKDYILQLTFVIIFFTLVIIFWSYVIKWQIENKLYISEVNLVKCLSTNLMDEITIEHLANFRTNESIIWDGLSINEYNSLKKKYYPRKEYITCDEDNKYCKYYNYENQIFEQLSIDFQEKCIEQNQEKLWELSWLKNPSWIYDKYLPIILLDWIKNDKMKLDLNKVKKLNKCIDENKWNLNTCIIEINIKNPYQ